MESCRFCLSFSTILTTSIFPSFIRSWLSTNPFSLFRALLFKTVFCFSLANEMDIGHWETEFETLPH